MQQAKDCDKLDFVSPFFGEFVIVCCGNSRVALIGTDTELEQ